MADTKIEWATKVWNPVRGCSPVSEGCRNCYAMKQAHRFSGPGKPYKGLTVIGPHGPRWNGKVRLVPEVLDAPLHWRKPQRVFVDSMGDPFHEKVPPGFLRAMMQSALLAIKERGHTFIFITKRAGRMLWYLNAEADTVFQGYLAHEPRMQFGVSVENQPTADERIPKLLQCPVATRIVSYEPSLGAVDFTQIQAGNLILNSLVYLRLFAEESLSDLRRVDQIIAGGESGPGARPPHPDWFRSARDKCQDARIPFFFKQWGEWAPVVRPLRYAHKGESTRLGFWDGDGNWRVGGDTAIPGEILMNRVGKKAAGRLLDGREWNEYPKLGNRE